MRSARWKLENDSNTYDFICCPPHNFGGICGWGDKTGKSLQGTQLGNEVNKYSNLESSWSFMIFKKEKKKYGAMNIYFSNVESF